MITTRPTTLDSLSIRDYRSKSTQRINGRFVKGPIPLTWISKAACLPGKALNAGLACWYQMGLNRSPSFKLSNVLARQFGLDKDSKARALRQLENAGLIRCQRTIGRSVEIEMLNTD